MCFKQYVHCFWTFSTFGNEGVWLRPQLKMPAPLAKLAFMARSVPSMIQEINAGKNNQGQWFQARKCIFIFFCLALMALQSISLSDIFITQQQKYWFIYYLGGMIKSLQSLLSSASNIDDILI